MSWDDNQQERSRGEIERDLDRLLEQAVNARQATDIAEDLNDVAESWAERNGHDQ